MDFRIMRAEKQIQTAEEISQKHNLIGPFL